MAGIDANCLLCLHCNGVDGSQSFTDSSSSAHTMTAVGEAQIDTNPLILKSGFGTGMALLDGSGDKITSPDHADWDLMSDATDYTIDAWIYPQAAGAFPIAEQYEDTNNYWCLQVTAGSGGNIRFLAYTDGDFAVDVVSSCTININTWYHIVLTRKIGGEYKTFLSGTQVGSTTTDASTDTYAGGLVIGNRDNGAAEAKGIMDEIRFSNILRWTTSPFTPPTAEYTSSTPAATGMTRRCLIIG